MEVCVYFNFLNDKILVIKQIHFILIFLKLRILLCLNASEMKHVCYFKYYELF